MTCFWNERSIFSGHDQCATACFLYGSSLERNGWAVFSEQLYELGLIMLAGNGIYYNPTHSWMFGDDNFLAKNAQWLRKSALKDTQGRFYAVSVIHPLSPQSFTVPGIRILRDPRNSVMGMQKYYKKYSDNLHDAYVLFVPPPVASGGFFGLPYVEEFFLQLILLRSVNRHLYKVFYEGLKAGPDELYRFANAVCLPVTEEQCAAAYTRSLAHTRYISKEAPLINRQVLDAHVDAIGSCFTCDLPYCFASVSSACSWSKTVLFQAIQLHVLNLSILYPFFDTPRIKNILTYAFLHLSRQLDRIPLLRVYLSGVLRGSALHDFAQRELAKLMEEGDPFAALCARAIYEGNSVAWLQNVLELDLLVPQKGNITRHEPVFRLLALCRR